MIKFRIIESSIGYINREFKCYTQIKKMVVVPYNDDEFRCIMFDGLKIHLKNENNYIIGRLG